MTPWTDLIFYAVFLSQIILLSWYFPNRMNRRVRTLLQTYPPQDYPRLYPHSAEYYRRTARGFQMINWAILAIGLVLLVLIAAVVDHRTFADDGYISEAWPALYGIVQVLPLIATEIIGFGQLRLMRQSATSRRADLHPRRLSDFVSPLTIVLVVLLFAGALAFDWYANGYRFQWDQAAAFVLANVVMAASAGWVLFGRKQDPHQRPQDRALVQHATVRSSLYGSVIISLFIAVRALDDLLDLDYLDATLMSLFFQAIVAVSVGTMLRRVKIEHMDFEVYRGKAPAGSS